MKNLLQGGKCIKSKKKKKTTKRLVLCREVRDRMTEQKSQFMEGQPSFEALSNR